jgi:hypothetical protein
MPNYKPLNFLYSFSEVVAVGQAVSQNLPTFMLQIPIA